MYDSIKEPLEHIENLKGWKDIYAYNDAMRCWAFQLTLIDKVKTWYHTLKPNIIGSFKEFGKKFLSHFLANR